MVNERYHKNFEDVAVGLPHLVFGCRENGARTWPSPQWVFFTGVSAADSVGFGWLEAVHPDDRRVTMEAWVLALSTGEYLVDHRIRRDSDGSYPWHQTRASALPGPVVLPSGTVQWIGASADIDELYRSRQRAIQAERDLRILVEGVPQLLWRSCDMGEWTWASPQWLEFTGQSQEQSHGRGWLEVVHPDDRQTAMAAWAAARPQGLLDVEFRVYCAADRRHRWHRTCSAPVRNSEGRIVEWLGTTTDIHELKALQQRQQVILGEIRRQTQDLRDEIQERKQIEARLLRTTLHDDLTGLHNRAFIMRRLALALDRLHDQAGGSCTLLFLDLDRFKLVNDSLGHQTGDLMLVEVGKRLRDCVGPRHTLARFGGDEFAVLVEDTAEFIAESGAVTALAGRIIEVMRRVIRLGPQEIFTSCSIGIVHATRPYLTPDEVMRDADIAMYHSKRQESGGYAVFTETMRDSAIEALELRTDLRNAIPRHEFVLHYQPIHNIDTGIIVGVEALIRWQHPRRGLISPAAFVAVAEETGLIREIGRWVLSEACGQLCAWLDRFPGLDLYVSANSSGVELRDPAYTSYVSDALSAARLDPRRLQLEVTESVFLHQPAAAGEMLESLRALGVRVALDDFGTGYSSLSYLGRYQIDTLKIDRSFVVDVLSCPNTAAIVEAIAGLGKKMGLDIVAEGIENDAQLQALRAAGCKLAQGYLLGRPASATVISTLLASQS